MRTEKSCATAKAQSAIEFLVTYSWAFLITAIALAALFYYISVPYAIASTTCTFADGLNCSNIILAASPGGSARLTLYLINQQRTPIINPTIYGSSSGSNTTAYGCFPQYVLPGGSIICMLAMNSGGSSGSFASGKLYMNATVCSTDFSSTGPCTGQINETFTGTYAGTVQPAAPLLTLSFTFNAITYAQLAGSGPDGLKAYIRLDNNPFPGATVNFTTNSSAFTVSPKVTMTNASGTAITFLSSAANATGEVLITGRYYGISNSITVYFQNGQPAAFQPSKPAVTSKTTTTAISSTSTTKSTTTSTGSSTTATTTKRTTSTKRTTTSTGSSTTTTTTKRTTSTKRTTASSTSVTTAPTTTISYSLTMQCSGPVSQDCGISPSPGITYIFPSGSTVYLSAQASVKSAYCSSHTADFVDWSGAYSGGKPDASFTMNRDSTETATYACG